MNCYNFVENITRFIDNELKQDYRELFLTHKNSCKKCSNIFNSVSNNITLFNNLKNFKTSDNFLEGLNQKIYNYENSSSIWKRISHMKFFETPPIYYLGYASILLLLFYSSYSLVKMDFTDYNKLNEKVSTNLKENSFHDNTDSLFNKENHYSNNNQLADEDDFSKTQHQQKYNSFSQPILPVSKMNSNRQINNKRQQFKRSSSVSSKLINNMQHSMIHNKEDYIIEYEKKNRFYKKRKDSLLNILNFNTDKNIGTKIKTQIIKDSLEQLEYYRNFDKIQKK